MTEQEKKECLREMLGRAYWEIVGIILVCISNWYTAAFAAIISAFVMYYLLTAEKIWEEKHRKDDID